MRDDLPLMVPILFLLVEIVNCLSCFQYLQYLRAPFFSGLYAVTAIHFQRIFVYYIMFSPKVCRIQFFFSSSRNLAVMLLTDKKSRREKRRKKK